MINVCACMRIYVCMCTYINIYAFVWLHVCMRVVICVCMCMCVCMCTYINIRACVWLYVYASVYNLQRMYTFLI